MTSVWLLLVGLGTPALGLLLGRRLAAEDVARTVRQHHEALVSLGEITRTTSRRP